MDDREAISRLKRGDIGGLETLVSKYQAQALKAAYLITGERFMAEDIVQAAFLRVYERAGQFHEKRPFRPWFLRIVVNDAMKAVSKRGRQLSRKHNSNEEEVSLTELVPDPGPGPEEWAEQAQVQQAVREALAWLSPAQRAVVIGRYYLGLSEAELAEQGGQARGTVKQLLHRARGRLKLLLGATSSER